MMYQDSPVAQLICLMEDAAKITSKIMFCPRCKGPGGLIKWTDGDGFGYQKICGSLSCGWESVRSFSDLQQGSR